MVEISYVLKDQSHHSSQALLLREINIVRYTTGVSTPNSDGRARKSEEEYLLAITETIPISQADSRIERLHHCIVIC